MPSKKAQELEEQIQETKGQHDEPVRLDMLMPVKQETSYEDIFADRLEGSKPVKQETTYEDISADRLEESKMPDKTIIDRLKFENDTDGYELDAARRTITSDISPPTSCGPVKEEICDEGITEDLHGDSEMRDKSIIDKLKFETDVDEYEIDAARRRISSDIGPTSCGTVKQEICYDAISEAEHGDSETVKEEICYDAISEAEHGDSETVKEEICYDAISEAEHGDSDTNKENLRRDPLERGRTAGRVPLRSNPSVSWDGNSAANVQTSRGKRGGRGKTRSNRRRRVHPVQARGRAGGVQKRPLAQNDSNIGLEESPLRSSLDAPPFAKRRKFLVQEQDIKQPKYNQPSTSVEHSYARPSSAYIGCEMNTPSTDAEETSSPPVNDDGIFNLLNYGSEEESEDADEENEDLELSGLPCGSRVERAMADIAEDTPEEAEAAGRVESPCVEAAEPDGDGVMHGPTALFDFEWQAYPSAPIDPCLRREQFVGRPGPIIGPISNVYDAFVLIWDRPIMEHIAAETNMYAQECGVKLFELGSIWPSSWKALWRDTDVDELYVYFSLILTMGIVVKTRLEDYWADDGSAHCTPYFAAHMSLKRFQILSKFLHFNSNSDISLHNTIPSQAKLHKVLPIVDHLNEKFSTLYGLGQSIALDESLTRWKSRPNITQNIPDKAAAVDIKTYEVCDCRTGYLWRFECHAGGEQAEVQQGVISGTIPNVVLRLLRGIEYRGHTVWMDDYYNSPALARVLKSMGYDCVGTLRTNRQFVPRQLTDLKKKDMMVDGVCGYTSGDVDLIVWRCPNRVALLSTYHGAFAFKDKLIAILDYNTCMGGVDFKDRTLSAFPVDWKHTRSWYKKFFWRLLNVSVLNAYVLYEHTHDISHKKFRMDLVKQLLDKHRKSAPALIAGTSLKCTQDFVAHFPRELPDCYGDEKADKLCVVCKIKRTNYVCARCNVSLCIDFADLVSSCYMKYHS